MDILFVIPRAFASYPGATVPHLGVAYLVAVLRRNGFGAAVLDLQLGYGTSDLIARIRRDEPGLIGVSAYSFAFDHTRDLIDTIKGSARCPVVVGGPHVAAFPDQVLRQTAADFAIRGEGEVPIVELCRTLEAGSDAYSAIPSLIWRSGDRVVENRSAPLIRDLDGLPFPDFEAFELSRYVFSVDRRLPLATSRGCPYRCNYCSVQLSMGRSFRPRSPKNVVEEIAALRRKGWRYLDIVDDCFTMDLRRAKSICDLLVEEGMDVEWSLGNGTRADRMDEELLVKMKRAGCRFIAYGLESGDDEVLKAIRKGITIERARRTFELTRKVGIRFAVNFIIGHPTETYEKAVGTLRFAASIPCDYVNVYNLLPYPRTELYEWVEKHGRFLVDRESYLSRIATRVQEPVFETPEFTREERCRALGSGFALARRKHLRYRFGPLVATLLWWPVARCEGAYLLAKRLMLGTRSGRRVFNWLKRGH